MTKKFLGALIVMLTFSSFIQSPTLKGTWIFAGGIYNGKAESAPTEYTLQRKYNDADFEAWVLEKGEQPVKYQTGKYELRADTCLETETFNIQSKALTGVALHYRYTLRNDSLIFAGKMPSGMVVNEYWVRVK